MKRPQNLVYALDEAPPLVTALNGVQHVGLIAINLVYPLLIFRVAGLTTATVAEILAMGMIVLGRPSGSRSGATPSTRRRSRISCALTARRGARGRKSSRERSLA